MIGNTVSTGESPRLVRMIVGAGAVTPRPWVCDGALAVRQLCTLSLAADHRVTDGRVGAQFLGRIARLVAAPDSAEWRAG